MMESNFFRTPAPRRGYFTSVHFFQRDNSKLDTVNAFLMFKHVPSHTIHSPKEGHALPIPVLGHCTSHICCTSTISTRFKSPFTRMPTHPPRSPTYIAVQQGMVSSHVPLLHVPLLRVPFYTAQSHTYARHVQGLSSRKLPGYAIHSFSPSFFLKSTLKQFTRPLHNLPISTVLIREDRL